MPFTEDNIGAALRDYALDQVAYIDMQLARAGAWQHEGVHLGRKAIARLRACLDLLHKSPLAAPALERRLRVFAHALSPLRDTQAALTTAKILRGRSHRSRERHKWQGSIGELKSRRERVLGAALMVDPGFAAHRGQVAETRAAIATIAWTRLQESDLRAALNRSAKRAHRASDPARNSRTELPRHRLRRRSRRLLLQIELLRMIAHDLPRPLASGIARGAMHQVLGKSIKRRQRKRLIDELGWEQDLRVLRRALPARATTSSVRHVVAFLRQELEHAQASTNSTLD